MNTKPPESSCKKSGFSLVELLVAMGIAAIVLTSALGVLSSIYFSQKQVLFSHDYFSENRFLMERVAQLVRNNTLDYDRMFMAYGPSTILCGSFNASQTPSGSTLANNPTNRADLGYSTIFYWNTDGDSDQDRNLGGKRPDASDDPCTEAWSTATSLDVMYLINSVRSQKVAIQLNNDRVEVQRLYGADTNNDGEADLFGPTGSGAIGVRSGVGIEWDNGGRGACELVFDLDNDTINEYYPILVNATDRDHCFQAHDFVEISPNPVIVTELNFQAYPTRDPYLAFRVDLAQVHPMVFISMSTVLRDPSKYGFTNPPELSFQTAVSSRVYGDIRR